MAPPLAGLDDAHSAFQGREVDLVPVVRVFGATPAGQKACLHLHKASLSLLVRSVRRGPAAGPRRSLVTPSSLGLPALIFVRKLATGIELAMKLASSVGGRRQHVHSCSLVRAWPVYGFHPQERLFAKIVLYHPQEVKRIATILQSGAILNRKFQPYEAHIPFLLQLLVDYNLQGMAHVNLSKVNFRPPLPLQPYDLLAKLQALDSSRCGMPEPIARASATAAASNATPAPALRASPQPEGKARGSGGDGAGGSGNSSSEGATGSRSAAVFTESTVPAEWISGANEHSGKAAASRFDIPARQSCCELEADGNVEDILNRRELLSVPLEQAGPEIKLVQSLIPIWEDEMRRSGMTASAEAAQAPTAAPPRQRPPPSELDETLRQAVRALAAEDKAGLRINERREEERDECGLFQSSQPANLVAGSSMGPPVASSEVGHDTMDPGCQGEANADDLVDVEAVTQLRRDRLAKDADTELSELLQWMGATPRDGDDEDDGKPPEAQAVTTQRHLARAQSSELALQAAMREYEAASQRECDAILDCGEDSVWHGHEEANGDAEDESEVLRMRGGGGGESTEEAAWTGSGGGGCMSVTSSGSGHNGQRQREEVSLRDRMRMQRRRKPGRHSARRELLGQTKSRNSQLQTLSERRPDAQPPATRRAAAEGEDQRARVRALPLLSGGTSGTGAGQSSPGLHYVSRPSSSTRGCEAEDDSTRLPSAQLGAEVLTAMVGDDRDCGGGHHDLDARPAKRTGLPKVGETAGISKNSVGVGVQNAIPDIAGTEREVLCEPGPAAEVIEGGNEIPRRDRLVTSDSSKEAQDVAADVRTLTVGKHQRQSQKVVSTSQSLKRRRQEVAKLDPECEPLGGASAAAAGPERPQDRDGMVALRFRRPPPCPVELQGSWALHGLQPVNHGGVFYSTASDVPERPVVVGGMEFKVRSHEAVDLPPAFRGKSAWHAQHGRPYGGSHYIPEVLPDPVAGVPLSFNARGEATYLVSPARPPPPRAAVVAWVQKHLPTVSTISPAKQREGGPLYTVDANTGKLVPVDASSGHSQGGSSQGVLSEEEPAPPLERPASPKYDEMVTLLPVASPHSSGRKATRRAEAASSSPGSRSGQCRMSTPPNVPLSRSPAAAVPATAKEFARSAEELERPLPNLSQEAVQTAARTTPVQAAVSPDMRLTAGMRRMQRKWRNVSQITPPSPAKDRPATPSSQTGFSRDGLTAAAQQVTVMSIEVQAESRGDLKPDPRYDAIACIALCVQDDRLVAEADFPAYACLALVVDAQLHSSAPQKDRDAVSGCTVLYQPDEVTLLHRFSALVSDLDPDMLVGWEIQGASLGLIAERAANLGVPLIKLLSRTPPASTRPVKPGDTQAAIAFPAAMKSTESASPDASHVGRRAGVDLKDVVNPLVEPPAGASQPLAPNQQQLSAAGVEAAVDALGLADSIIEDEWGRTHGSGIHVTGRVVLNFWRIVQGEMKLNIYTLEAVAEAVLRRKAPRFSCRQLTAWLRSRANRWRALDHCVERAKLNIQIMNQLDLVSRTGELARVFGIDFFSVLTRGSQYRVESMLLRIAHTQNYLLLAPSRQQVEQQPAMEALPLVMEPESRFYTSPVIVLDFQSLYPSCIIAYNLCFSTCLGKIARSDGPKKLGVSTLSLAKGALSALHDCLLLLPNAVMYTPPQVRPGLLPRLLREILVTRVMVKQAMKKLPTSQRVLYRVLNARQLALKLISNVTYGYTAAGFSGRMPCAELADSIVQQGRLVLEKAIEAVNTTAKWGARVVYGDTDSLFVLVEGRSRSDAFRIGAEIAAAITAANPDPIVLKLEKVYHPCFLLTKKRYVGYAYESAGQARPAFDAKGIETVRRDSCAVVVKCMERSLRLMFETKDLSQVKRYLQRQWGKILGGRVSIADFVFAKEVRLGSYSPNAAVLPPAAIVASKAMVVDPRAEPRYAERIPYVVVYGEPGARLVDMVVDPHVLVNSAGTLRLHGIYYITKQILPAIQRIFGLIGADLRAWFAEMPRIYRPPSSKRPQGPRPRLPWWKRGEEEGQADVESDGDEGPARAKSTIDQYYLSRRCATCAELTRASQQVCSSCRSEPQIVAAILAGRAAKLEREYAHLAALCKHCGGGAGSVGGVACISLDCRVFFERKKTQSEFQATARVAAQLGSYHLLPH
eukprot:SM000091S24579  [mRNA]  locus=s91:158707:170125:- [translate_table: standard]